MYTALICRVHATRPERHEAKEVLALLDNAPILRPLQWKLWQWMASYYMAAPGDVGRGECMDIDPGHMGWEMWSTMGGVYDAKGELIPGLTAPYPTEGIWWDSEPDREIVQTSDSHHNVYVQDFFKGRLIEIAKIVKQVKAVK